MRSNATKIVRSKQVKGETMKKSKLGKSGLEVSALGVRSIASRLKGHDPGVIATPKPWEKGPVSKQQEQREPSGGDALE